jgi:protein involved in polysaccharide export with SLBB domain
LSHGRPKAGIGRQDVMFDCERLSAPDRERATMRMALVRAASLGALMLAAAGAQAAQGGGRVLTTSDVVAIRVVENPDLDWTARVEPDGTINFPYVGRIRAAGLTEDGLARTIERRLIELKIIAGP